MQSHDKRRDQSTPRLARDESDRLADEAPDLPVLPGGADDIQAPASLAASVMARVARLDAFLAPDAPVDALLAATTAPAWEARAAATYALGVHATSETSAALAAALHDDDVTTRVAAIHALCRQSVQAPLDQLIVTLRDPAWEAREAVALALGEAVANNAQLAEPARPLLLAALHDAHPVVRAAAHYALAAVNARPTVATLTTPGTAAAAASTLSTIPAAPILRDSTRNAPVAVRHFWQTLVHQPMLIRRGWVIPVLVALASELTVLFIAQRVTGNLHDMSSLLAIVTALAAAVGVAFGANLALDPGAELALATPTSPRVILLCRYCVVVGVTFILSGCASLVEATLAGQSLLAVVQLWLGPTLLLASLTLALVMIIGSWLSTLVACLLELAQVARIGPGGALLPLAQPHLWMTSPLVLGLAAVCLALALLYAPRQPRRFASFGDR